MQAVPYFKVPIMKIGLWSLQLEDGRLQQLKFMTLQSQIHHGQKVRFFSCIQRRYVAFGLADIRPLTAATAAVTHEVLFTEMPCYVLGRLYSSCVLSTKVVLHRIEIINKTLVNDDFSNFF